MNWKLIFGLSFLGLIIIFAIAYFNPFNVGPFVGIFVGFIFLAFMAAKFAPGKYFWHGFCISIANCIWVLAARILLLSTNIIKPAQELDVRNKMQMLQGHSKLEMVIIGIIAAVVSGVVLGLFCFIASKVVGRKR